MFPENESDWICCSVPMFDSLFLIFSTIYHSIVYKFNSCDLDTFHLQKKKIAK